MRDWLIELRNKKGFTAQETAEKLNISLGYYSMIENGKRQKHMDITLITKIADVFGISAERIIALETPKELA